MGRFGTLQKAGIIAVVSLAVLATEKPAHGLRSDFLANMPAPSSLAMLGCAMVLAAVARRVTLRR